MMTTFYWHVHNEILVEPLTEPVENRIAFIKAYKPKKEIPIRLRWLTPVQGELPRDVDKTGAAYDKTGAAYAKAGAAYDKAGAAYAKAGAAYDKAVAAYDKAVAAYAKAVAAYSMAAAMPAIEALHAVEHPGCPWNGKTLLP